jgi:ectoine hydroxylase-related dioxygenase (phytanoyl-CoA dioxygenase family)
MGAVADEKGYWVCNSVWMLDDFTTENGAIRMVPGSHRWKQLPQAALADPRATHAQEVFLTGKAGTVVVMNAHMWHGGLGNRTGKPRTALHVFFARRDKPQQQYQKQLLRPEVQARLSPQLRWLLALDDPLNDRLATEATVRSGFLK